MGDTKSTVLVSNTGAPLDWVLSQFFTLCIVLTFQSYLSSVVYFSNWCSTNCLHVNFSKTKEMYIDFRYNNTVINPIVINGEPLEQVDSFKYPCVVLDTKLSSTDHATVVQKKSQQRVLRKLQAFNVDPNL